MELQSITQELRQAGSRLSKGADELFKLATEVATEKDAYRKAFVREIMRLKDEKQPVTLIRDIAKGNISEVMFRMELAEAKFSAGKELLESLRAQVSALQSVLRYQEHA